MVGFLHGFWIFFININVLFKICCKENSNLQWTHVREIWPWGGHVTFHPLGLFYQWFRSSTLEGHFSFRIYIRHFRVNFVLSGAYESICVGRGGGLARRKNVVPPSLKTTLLNIDTFFNYGNYSIKYKFPHNKC